MNYLLYITLGILPSIIWLLFYLQEDVHPESNRMIIKIFFYGILAALLAALIELGIFDIIFRAFGETFSSKILGIFLGVALVEESVKYLVVREKVVSDPEFDEPVDAALYMIIAALGFAALENLLVLFPSGQHFLFSQMLSLSVFRFLGATFLHTLCSGTVGFFLALSFFKPEIKSRLLITGLGIATILHGLYNFSIMELRGSLRFLIPVIILISLAIFILLGFKRLKKMRSICKIK